MSWKNSKTFLPAQLSQPQIINILEIFKEFPASKPSSRSNRQSFSNQQQQPAVALNSSNQQQQPAAATNNGSQQQQSIAASSSSNQQRQPAAATSSSNQQQQPAAATSNHPAINNSNQQQRPAAASNSNNQLSSYQQHLHDQRQPLLVFTTVPSRGYPASS